MVSASASGPAAPAPSARLARTRGSASGCADRRGARSLRPSADRLEHVGQSEIGQHRRLVRHDLQRGRIILPRFLVAAELIERRALRRQDAPVGILRRMRAAEHVEGLLEIAIVGERAAVAGEQRLVAGMGEHGLLEHRDRLGALAGLAQRLAVVERDVGIARLGAIALAKASMSGLASAVAAGSDLPPPRARRSRPPGSWSGNRRGRAPGAREAAISPGERQGTNAWTYSDHRRRTDQRCFPINAKFPLRTLVDPA